MTTMTDIMQHRADWEAEPFQAIAAFGLARGAAPLSQYDGCWKGVIDETWTVIVNGHGKAMTHPDAWGEVDPFTAHVYYNGWLAAVLGPLSDGLFAAGEGANTATFAKAVADAIATQDERSGE